MGKIFRLYATPGVADGEHEVVVLRTGIEGDAATLRRVLQGVRQEVADHFLQIVGHVVTHEGGLRRVIPQLDALGFGQAAMAFGNHDEHGHDVATAPGTLTDG